MYDQCGDMEIEISELLKIEVSERMIIDIRPSDTYRWGSIEGAVNIPADEISVHNVNLKTIIGYHRDGQKYSFLDDYDEHEGASSQGDVPG